MNRPKMVYYHLDRPGPWIERRSYVTETPRTGAQQGPTNPASPGTAGVPGVSL